MTACPECAEGSAFAHWWCVLCGQCSKSGEAFGFACDAERFRVGLWSFDPGKMCLMCRDTAVVYGSPAMPEGGQ